MKQLWAPWRMEYILGEESYRIEPKTAEVIEQTQKKGGRVDVVGIMMMVLLPLIGLKQI